MRRFNLSEWALANRPLVLFAMLAFALIGAWSYKHLGQSEDPPFTFKAMVVRTLWPGATAEQVSRQPAFQADPGPVVPGAQARGRHPCDAAARDRRSVLQR